MSNRFVLPIWQLFNRNGVPLSGATLGFYVSGTTSLKSVFADAELTVPLANPVQADADGEFPEIFLDEGLYKVVLKDGQGVSRWTADPVQSAAAAARQLVGDVLVNAEDYSSTQVAADAAHGKAFHVPAGETVTISVPVQQSTIQDAIDVVSRWTIGNEAFVNIVISGDHTEPATVQVDYAHDRGVRVVGASEVISNVSMKASGHAVVENADGSYTYTMAVDSVADIEVGDVVLVPHNGYDGASDLTREKFEFPFARISAAMAALEQAAAADPGDDIVYNGPIRQGYIVTEGTKVTLSSSATEPSLDAKAKDFVSVGQLFFTNGQMRTVAAVSEEAEFYLDYPLERDLDVITTYWWVFDPLHDQMTASGTAYGSGGKPIGTTVSCSSFAIGDNVEVGGVLVTRAGFFPITAIQDSNNITVRGNCFVEDVPDQVTPFSYLPADELLTGAFQISAVGADTISFAITTHEALLDPNVAGSKVVPPTLGLKQTKLKILKDRVTCHHSLFDIHNCGLALGDIALIGVNPSNPNESSSALQSINGGGVITKTGELGIVGFDFGLRLDNGATAYLQKMYASGQFTYTILSVGSHFDLRYSCLTYAGSHGVFAITNSGGVVADCTIAGGKGVGVFGTTGAVMNVERARAVYCGSTAVQIQAGGYASGVESFCQSNPGANHSFSRGSSGRFPGSWCIGGTAGCTATGSDVEYGNALIFGTDNGMAIVEGSSLEASGLVSIGNYEKGVSLARGVAADLSGAFVTMNGDNGVTASVECAVRIDDLVPVITKDQITNDGGVRHNGDEDFEVLTGANMAGKFYIAPRELSGTAAAEFNGTLSANDSTAVLGDGTLFNSQLVPGATVKAGGVEFVVASITDDQNLVAEDSVTITAGTSYSANVVSGDGSAFLTDIQVGNVVEAGAIEFEVESVIDDDTLLADKVLSFSASTKLGVTWPNPLALPTISPGLAEVGITGEYVDHTGTYAPTPFFNALGGVKFNAASQKLVYARSGELNHTFGLLSPGQHSDATDGISGALEGDVVTLSISDPPEGVGFNAWVSGENQVTIRAFNYSQVNQTPGSVSVCYDVRRYQ